MVRALLQSDAIRGTLGGLAAGYLRFVKRTTTLHLDPPDLFERIEASWPFIVGMWHGQTLMMPFTRRDGQDVRVLVSKSFDGDIIARASTKLGLGLVRGSGGNKPQKMHKKGAVAATRALLEALNERATVALTADMPGGTAREPGLGIITLARLSGRPIVPLAAVTSRRIRLNNWDRQTINLPFGRMAFSIGEPLTVSRSADEAEVSNARATLKQRLDAAHERAYSLADGTGD